MNTTSKNTIGNDPTARAFDVVVVGGGAAGLTAAVTLGRARRSVLVIDSGEPRNAPADGVHMFLTRDGIPPDELVRIGRAEAAYYGSHFVDVAALAARRTDTGFEVELADGSVVRAKRLVVTTGLVDELPNVPGLRELWGKDVHHCPYCHGWELDGQAVGILGTDAMAVHKALMLRQWVQDLTLFVHTAPEPTPEQAEQLASRGIRIVDGEVEALEMSDGRLARLRMVDGSAQTVQSVVINPVMKSRSELLCSLGLTPTPHPMGVGEFIAADPAGLTEVPGVWVAGNVTDLSAGVIAAAAAGMVAAVSVNADLTAEDTARAVAARQVSLERRTVGARAV